MGKLTRLNNDTRAIFLVVLFLFCVFAFRAPTHNERKKMKSKLDIIYSKK
jgi:hypothetical protein